MTKRFTTEQFPYEQYQNPSQYYKMLVVKIVRTDADAFLLRYWKIHDSHLPQQIFSTLTSEQKHYKAS